MSVSKINITHAIWLSLLAYGLCIVCIMRSWNPSLSHDTFFYYYPRMTQTTPGFDQHEFLSFFQVPAERTEPDAAEAKPIFVLILKGWHLMYAILNSGSLPYPNDRVFNDFIVFTLVLSFGSLCWLGVVLGKPWIGLLSAWSSMLTPWMITASFFSTYTALSLAMLSSAIIALVHERPRPDLAGALIFANLFINQSTTVFAVACLAFIVLPKEDTWRNQLREVFEFAIGFVIAWLTFEAIILLQRIYTEKEWLFLWQILDRYLARSINERLEFFAVYEDSLLFYMLWQHSKFLSFTLSAGLAAICYSAARNQMFLDSQFKGLLVFCLVAVLLIDARVGPKFSRTYVLLLPFLTLVSFQCVAHFLLRSMVREPRIWILSALLLCGFVVEQAVALVRMEHAFLDVRRTIVKLSKERPIFFAANDTYFPFFKQLVGDEDVKAKMRVFSEVCDLRDLSKAASNYVLIGPNTKSLLNLPGWHTRETQLPLPNGEKTNDVITGRCADALSWEARKIRMLSFFSHYPFLLLEDPQETYRLIATRETSLSDFYSGIGRVTLWRVSFSRADK